MFKYQTDDGEKFLRKLPARQHVVDKEDVSHSKAEEMIEEITEDSKEEEEKLDVFEFRVIEYLAAERSVKVKATCKDEAERRAEEALLSQDPEITHTVHEEIDKLNKIDEVPRSKIESGEYWEEDSSDKTGSGDER